MPAQRLSLLLRRAREATLPSENIQTKRKEMKASLGPFLEQRLRERQAWVCRRAFPSRADKAVRAQSIRGRMACRGLYLPPGASWRAELESELLRFPAGVHDDTGGVGAGVYDRLCEMGHGGRVRSV